MTLEGRNMPTIKDDEALYQNLKKKSLVNNFPCNRNHASKGNKLTMFQNQRTGYFDGSQLSKRTVI